MNNCPAPAPSNPIEGNGLPSTTILPLTQSDGSSSSCDVTTLSSASTEPDAASDKLLALSLCSCRSSRLHAFLTGVAIALIIHVISYVLTVVCMTLFGDISDLTSPSAALGILFWYLAYACTMVVFFRAAFAVMSTLWAMEDEEAGEDDDGDVNLKYEKKYYWRDYNYALETFGVLGFVFGFSAVLFCVSKTSNAIIFGANCVFMALIWIVYRFQTGRI